MWLELISFLFSFKNIFSSTSILFRLVLWISGFRVQTDTQCYIIWSTSVTLLSIRLHCSFGHLSVFWVTAAAEYTRQLSYLMKDSWYCHMFRRSRLDPRRSTKFFLPPFSLCPLKLGVLGSFFFTWENSMRVD